MPENSPDPLLICISGGDGSGKSTQVAALEKQLTDRGIHTATATIWDPFTDPFVAERLPFRTREDVFAYVRILGPGARGYFLFHWMRLAFDRALAHSPNILLINAYWYKYFATEIAHGADPKTLRACTQGFPTPHHTFYLRITPETALSRNTTAATTKAATATNELSSNSSAAASAHLTNWQTNCRGHRWTRPCRRTTSPTPSSKASARCGADPHPNPRSTATRVRSCTFK